MSKHEHHKSCQPSDMGLMWECGQCGLIRDATQFEKMLEDTSRENAALKAKIDEWQKKALTDKLLVEAEALVGTYMADAGKYKRLLEKAEARVAKLKAEVKEYEESNAHIAKCNYDIAKQRDTAEASCRKYKSTNAELLKAVRELRNALLDVLHRAQCPSCGAAVFHSQEHSKRCLAANALIATSKLLLKK